MEQLLALYSRILRRDHLSQIQSDRIEQKRALFTKLDKPETSHQIGIPNQEGELLITFNLPAEFFKLHSIDVAERRVILRRDAYVCSFCDTITGKKSDCEYCKLAKSVPLF